MSDFLALAQPPDPGLFFRKNDPHDPRLGEAVHSDPAAYAGCRVAVIGCPQDEGVRRNGGRLGAARAPDEIRRWLYRLTTHGVSGARVFDAGNTRLGASLEATHAAHREIVRGLLRDGKRVVALGGGNDVSYPDAAALADVAGRITAVNIDAHFDARADLPRNSGTPYRQLLEEGLLDGPDFCEFGWQPQVNAAAYEDWLRVRGVRLIGLDAARAAPGGPAGAFAALLRELPPEGALFAGFDLDAVRASDAPGVSAPNPLGLAGEDMCALASLAARDPRTRLIEFSEVNPDHDIDGRTARLAATAIWGALAAWSPGP